MQLVFLRLCESHAFEVLRGAGSRFLHHDIQDGTLHRAKIDLRGVHEVSRSQIACPLVSGTLLRKVSKDEMML